MMHLLSATDKAHRIDKPNLQNAALVVDYAGRFRTGYWVFVGPGSDHTWKFEKYELENPKGNWDRKAPHILEVYSGSGHLVIPATTILEHGSLKTPKGKRNIHIDARDVDELEAAAVEGIEDDVTDEDMLIDLIQMIREVFDQVGPPFPLGISVECW